MKFTCGGGALAHMLSHIQADRTGTILADPVIRLLGQVHVRANDGRTAAPGSAIGRAVLAVLALRSGRTVGISDLADCVWEQPPASAAANLRSYAAGLRRLFHGSGYGEMLVTRRGRGGGYKLDLSLERVDAHEFVSIARLARRHLAAREYQAGLCAFDHALALWQGQVEGLPVVGRTLTAHLAELEELRLSSFEGRAQARLALGDPIGAVDDMAWVVAAHPLRERAWELLMRARYLSGDVVGALRDFGMASAALAEELGIEPGQVLQRLHVAILRREDHQIALPA